MRRATRTDRMVAALGVSHRGTRDVGEPGGEAWPMTAVAGEMCAAQSRRLVRACARVACGQAALTFRNGIVLISAKQHLGVREGGSSSMLCEKSDLKSVYDTGYPFCLYI